MPSPSDYLPLTTTAVPESQDELRAVVRQAYHTATPIYPLGGQTALDFGLVAKKPGIGLSLANLDHIVDYPARDLTITVEAGITISKLALTLAAENQRLPIDAPEPDQATLGGVIATNWSGPRRFASGTIRDYVIGISAVDGRGMAYKGGGRVVKNVAGYDFCKLLTGSLGVLGVITQVTLKLKPIPERQAWLACPVADHSACERLLSGLVSSEITPAAVEWLSGAAWYEDVALGVPVRNSAGCLAIAVEGTSAEVEFMKATLAREWKILGEMNVATFGEANAEGIYQRITAFPAERSSPLIVKASVLPSRMFSFIEAARAIDPNCSIQAHAGNGVVNVRFAHFPAAEVGQQLLGKLHPAAQRAGGRLVVLSWAGGGELTQPATFGNADAAGGWMAAVKKQFDPKHILNPGRFVV